MSPRRHDLRGLRRLALFAGILCATAAGSMGRDAAPAPLPGQTPQAAPAQPADEKWLPLFDGKTLQGWKETQFSGHGQVSIKDGAIVLDNGYMTGVTWTGSFPKSNYEIRFEAVRLEGNDFFAAITFPVKDAFCSWINGGWGGGVVGLSSIDGQDASENETGSYKEFVRDRWYAFRLRVTDEAIEAWIDEELVISVGLEDRAISLRWGEIDLSAPLGFATYSTVGALRKLEYRTLAPPAEAPKPQ